jgi:surface antigen
MKQKTVRRRLVRASIITVNTGLLALVLYFVLGARGVTADHQGSTSTHASSAAVATSANPLDQLSSADIAVTVSRMTGLSESTAVTNQADSEDVALTSAPVTDNVVSKPQVTATAFKSKNDIQAYTVVAGDTVTSIAAKYSVTSDSVRWSNGLSGDTVAAGTKLSIPPVGYSGIVYTVKAGDTLDSLATKYKADKTELTAANDAEIVGLKVGEQIIIPNGQQPVVKAATSYYSGYAWGTTAVYGSNGYDYGYCTWWVAQRRAAVGNPLPSNLGNASSWPYISRMAGLSTGNTPRQYAAAVTSTRGEGHVVFVESVNADGSIVISEMNHLGWAVKDTQTIDAGTASSYIYIY